MFKAISNGAVAEKADLKPVEEAIVASTPRVTTVEISNHHSGFAEVVTVTLVLKDSSSLTQEELLAVLKSLWKSVPFEPTYIEVGAQTESRENVDVKKRSQYSFWGKRQRLWQ